MNQDQLNKSPLLLLKSPDTPLSESEDNALMTTSPLQGLVNYCQQSPLHTLVVAGSASLMLLLLSSSRMMLDKVSFLQFVSMSSLFMFSLNYFLLKKFKEHTFLDNQQNDLLVKKASLLTVISIVLFQHLLSYSLGEALFYLLLGVPLHSLLQRWNQKESKQQYLSYGLVVGSLFCLRVKTLSAVGLFLPISAVLAHDYFRRLSNCSAFTILHYFSFGNFIFLPLVMPVMGVHYFSPTHWVLSFLVGVGLIPLGILFLTSLARISGRTSLIMLLMGVSIWQGLGVGVLRILGFGVMSYCMAKIIRSQIY